MKNNDADDHSYIIVRDTLGDGLELFSFGLEPIVGKDQLENFILSAAHEIIAEEDDKFTLEDFHTLEHDDLESIKDQIVVLEVSDYPVLKVLKRRASEGEARERQLYLRLKKKYEGK
jgi:hypothetical protein